MATPTMKERVSRLEGGYDHLATKADVERLRADMERNRGEDRAEMQRLRADFSHQVIRLGVAVNTAIAVTTNISLAVIKLAG